jgi:cytochrome c biogenesis protein CcdA
MGAVYGIEPRYVPTILIGDMVWEGYTDEFSQEITSFVERSLVEGSVDKGAAVIEGKGYIPFGASATAVAPTPAPTKTPGESTADNTNTRKLPLFGEVDFSKMGLFLSTALIAFVDGFNPCSLWVLSMLLAITMHTGSRKKVLVIGLVFLTVTAAIYALFIAGLFTVLKVVSFVGWIQVVVALVALFFGLVNIKDYFFYKEGVSFTISDDQKPGIYQRIRKVMDAGDSWWGLIGGTVVLAAGVSLVEFTCTAGFPVLWTNLVSSQQVTTITFVMLLLLYMLIYQLDELGIFLVAAFTLKSSRIEEKHGRILKLIGGVLMLTLAIVMLVKPELMSDVGKSLIVFGIAFAITLLILLVHRVILPKKGIHIGTENSKRAAVKSRRKTRHH